MAEDGFKVNLHIYDLSQGLARELSTTFLGKAIEAVWHTGLVVYGKEYYFSGGIQQDPAGRTPYGSPVRIVELGATHVPEDVFESYVQEISPRFTAETYNLLSHNCNNFSNEVAQFLIGASIPDYILQLPDEVINSPMSAQLLPMLQQLETTLKSGAVPQKPQFHPVSAPARPFTSVATSTQTKVAVNERTTTKSVESKASTKKSEKGNAESESSHNDHRVSVPMIQRLETTLNPLSVPRRLYPVSASVIAMPQQLYPGCDVPQTPLFPPVPPFRRIIRPAGIAPKTPVFTPAPSPLYPILSRAELARRFLPASATSTLTREKDSAVSAAAKSVKQPEVSDALGEARSRVKDEITKEFGAIMATGTLRASEAAALATRRVRERYGRLKASVQSG